MFSLRIEEVALPGAERNKEQLLEWLATSLNLIRRRSEESQSNLMGPPIFRMLQEHFLANPNDGHESIFLAESLAISPATKFPAAEAKNHIPIMNPTILCGESLVTDDRPTGDRHNSPSVCSK